MNIFFALNELVLASGAHAPAAAPHSPQEVVHVGYLWLIPLLPLLGSAVNAFVGHKLQKLYGKKITSHIAIGAMVGAFAVAVVAFAQMLSLPAEQRYLSDFVFNMFTAGDVQADLAFALDPLSMMMTLIITFIGTLIHIYSTGYMADEPAYWRFFCYLNLFVFSMLLLVMGDNFVLMFFGWEGVGLCSYLLIGFWYEDKEKAQAGVKAFVTNRFGDFGFVLGLFLLFWALGGSWTKEDNVLPAREAVWARSDPAYVPQVESGTVYRKDLAYAPRQPPSTYAEVEAQKGEGGKWQAGPAAAVRAGLKVGPTLNFRELRDQVVIEATGVKKRLLGMEFLGIPLLALVGILFFVGATSKSAQIPLYVWLPDAMAGPTPVSALIHAATMVTAGVYMVARLNFIFSLSPIAMTVIAVTGAATAMFAASIGFLQHDIKKVLAYSTVSQLGFMFIGVGVGAYWAGVYHLLTHAFFKACLFLGSGSVILGCHHEQDMRKMGGLKKYMPLTEKTYLYACIAIAGFPIANGFFSKDEILWKAFDSGSNLLDPTIGKVIWFVGWLTALGTSFYMWRSYYMTFTGEYRGGVGHGHAHADAHAPSATPVLATHSVGAAHAATFDHDVGHGGDSHGHGHHGGTPHESPRAMTWVLATLAIGCFLTIALGFWAPLGITPALEHWLEPVLSPSAALVHERSLKQGHALEYLLIGLSVAVAFGGWLIARALYKDAKSTVPATLAAKFPRVHRVVYNKYYVDELYQKTVLAGAMVIAKASSAFDRIVIDGAVGAVAAVGRFVCNIEGAIDKYLVDGAVNFVADTALRSGKAIRRLQTGRIQHYLYAALAGALIVAGINFLIR
ncbi:MAG: proton-conducting transporter membrane subunit [Myxococcota bacterium]